MQLTGNLGLVKNAIANVLRGGAAALVAIVLPPFLARLMSPDSYGAWLLVLQLSAFVGYLDFGIQTAIGRFVAHTEAKRDIERRNRIISTALAVLLVGGVVGIVGSIGLALAMPYLFRQVPAPLLGDVRLALVLVGSSLAVGLPCSVLNGIFIGLQRYEVPAVIIGGSRIMSAACVVVIVKHGGTLVEMGVAVAIANLVSYGIQYWVYCVIAPQVRVSHRLVSRDTGRELFSYCFSLSVWTFAMLLVSGLDVSLVGYFEFDKLAYYAVAATLITFLAGVQNAIFHVMIPSTAVLQAQGDSAKLGQRVVTATRYSTFILLLTGLPLILGGKFILNLWVGPKYAVEGARILQVLTVANIIRLSAVPYVMALIGTGQQRLVVRTPLLEGISNFVASVVAGYTFGALGIAFGTVIGGLVGILGNFVYNMPRTTELKFRTVDYIRDGLLRPISCALPLTAAALTFGVSGFILDARNSAMIGAAVVSTVLILWRWGLVSSERQRLRAWCTSLA